MIPSEYKKRPLSHHHLLSILTYCPETGVFWYRRTVHSHALKGSVAGSVKANGSRSIQIEGKVFKASRLAWFYVTGAWPEGVIICVDGDLDNLAIGNLRDVSRSEAMQRQRVAHCRNQSGHVGVTLHKQTGKWQVQLVRKGDGRRYYGLFDDPAEASEHYQSIKRELHYSPDPTQVAA